MDPSNHLWDFQGEGEFLLVDKPIDWTSFDVIKKIKVLFNVKRVGHAGTLDPKATGLLIICTGNKTKSLDSFQNEQKEYTGTFEVGARTPSFDSETAVIETRDFSHVDAELLEHAIRTFIGTILQTPPMYSAAKVDGKPLYVYARRGKNVDRSPKEVTIHDFQITGMSLPMVNFKIVCSKGTYVRTLAEDLGKELGCGCTLRSLRRTQIGSWRVENAYSIGDLINLRRTLESRREQPHEIGEPAW